MSNDELIEKIKFYVQNEVQLFNARDLMKIFHINYNSALVFLKKYGIRLGCYCIEKEKLLEILRTEKGNLL